MKLVLVSFFQDLPISVDLYNVPVALIKMEESIIPRDVGELGAVEHLFQEWPLSVDW
jgi:hypothetical protein